MSANSTRRRGLTVGPPSDDPLFEEVLYDLKLERKGFQRLAPLDAPGCRRALGALAARIDLAAGGPRGRQALQLLADVLHRVNRRVNPFPDREALFQANRAQLIRQFDGCEPDEGARDRFMSSLNALLAPLQSSDRGTHPLVSRAKEYIDSHYQRRLYLSAVAEALNISPNYLSRVFRRETGTTLTAHVQRVRLERARHLLAEGERSISEIAYRVGYQNYRDFYRNFVKYEHASPRQMQRRLAAAPRPAPRAARARTSG